MQTGFLPTILIESLFCEHFTEAPNVELFPDGRFVPLTFSMGFLESPFELVSDAYLAWTKQHHRALEIYPVDGGLSSGLSHLEPLSTPPRRKLLLATESKWTAYFDNGARGPDPMPPVSYLAQRLQCRGVVARSIPHIWKGEVGVTGTYGIVQFELFAPQPREFLNYERSVGALHDGTRWCFEVQGTVQPYEEVDQYSARKIRDRFTPEMLERYCSALGIRIFDETFYRGPGLLVVNQDPLPQGAEELTLIQAQSRLGRASR